MLNIRCLPFSQLVSVHLCEYSGKSFSPPEQLYIEDTELNEASVCISQENQKSKTFALSWRDHVCCRVLMCHLRGEKRGKNEWADGI